MPKDGSGAHGKAGSEDKGRDIDKTGETGKHHGGWLSGGGKDKNNDSKDDD